MRRSLQRIVRLPHFVGYIAETRVDLRSCRQYGTNDRSGVPRFILAPQVAASRTNADLDLLEKAVLREPVSRASLSLNLSSTSTSSGSAAAPAAPAGEGTSSPVLYVRRPAGHPGSGSTHGHEAVATPGSPSQHPGSPGRSSPAEGPRAAAGGGSGGGEGSNGEQLRVLKVPHPQKCAEILEAAARQPRNLTRAARLMLELQKQLHQQHLNRMGPQTHPQQRAGISSASAAAAALPASTYNVMLSELVRNGREEEALLVWRAALRRLPPTSEAAGGTSPAVTANAAHMLTQALLLIQQQQQQQQRHERAPRRGTAASDGPGDGREGALDAGTLHPNPETLGGGRKGGQEDISGGASGGGAGRGGGGGGDLVMRLLQATREECGQVLQSPDALAPLLQVLLQHGHLAAAHEVLESAQAQGGVPAAHTAYMALTSSASQQRQHHQRQHKSAPFQQGRQGGGGGGGGEGHHALACSADAASTAAGSEALGQGLGAGAHVRSAALMQHAQRGDVGRALAVYYAMRRDGQSPDGLACTQLLLALGGRGGGSGSAGGGDGAQGNPLDAAEALRAGTEIWQGMMEGDGPSSRPGGIASAAYTDLLVGAGLGQEACRILLGEMVVPRDEIGSRLGGGDGGDGGGGGRGGAQQSEEVEGEEVEGFVALRSAFRRLLLAWGRQRRWQQQRAALHYLRDEAGLQPTLCDAAIVLQGVAERNGRSHLHPAPRRLLALPGMDPRLAVPLHVPAGLEAACLWGTRDDALSSYMNLAIDSMAAACDGNGIADENESDAIDDAGLMLLIGGLAVRGEGEDAIRLFGIATAAAAAAGPSFGGAALFFRSHATLAAASVYALYAALSGPVSTSADAALRVVQQARAAATSIQEAQEARSLPSSSPHGTGNATGGTTGGAAGGSPGGSTGGGSLQQLFPIPRQGPKVVAAMVQAHLKAEQAAQAAADRGNRRGHRGSPTATLLDLKLETLRNLLLR